MDARLQAVMATGGPVQAPSAIAAGYFEYLAERNEHDQQMACTFRELANSLKRGESLEAAMWLIVLADCPVLAGAAN